MPSLLRTAPEVRGRKGGEGKGICLEPIWWASFGDAVHGIRTAAASSEVHSPRVEGGGIHMQHWEDFVITDFLEGWQPGGGSPQANTEGSNSTSCVLSLPRRTLANSVRKAGGCDVSGGREQGWREQQPSP